MAEQRQITIERTYEASSDDIWQLWTTAEGIESWWAPDGFTVAVRKLELEPAGELLYAMTATAPEQIAFMQSAGMPLMNEARKTFTAVDRPHRLGYMSVVDFVPGIEPYEFATVVELEPRSGGVRVVMTIDPMHDEEWTQRLVAGRENELDNLAAVIAARP